MERSTFCLGGGATGGTAGEGAGPQVELEQLGGGVNRWNSWGRGEATGGSGTAGGGGGVNLWNIWILIKSVKLTTLKSDTFTLYCLLEI